VSVCVHLSFLVCSACERKAASWGRWDGMGMAMGADKDRPRRTKSNAALSQVYDPGRTSGGNATRRWPLPSPLPTLDAPRPFFLGSPLPGPDLGWLTAGAAKHCVPGSNGTERRDLRELDAPVSSAASAWPMVGWWWVCG